MKLSGIVVTKGFLIKTFKIICGIKILADVAYFIGAAQSDGCLYSYLDRGYSRSRIYFHVSKYSLPMLRKVKEVSGLFGTKANITKNTTNGFCFSFDLKKCFSLFKKFDLKIVDPPIPPRWASSKKFFGAYLAGLIDGDGNIRVKNRFGRYRSCSVRIFSKNKPTVLASAIRKTCDCSVRISPVITNGYFHGKSVHGTCFESEFYISKKTYSFILNFILPYLTISKKVNIVKSFIEEQYGVVV